MVATLTCAAMTVIGFILGQVTEDKWKWDGDVEIEYTSAFYTGVYGMWNIYTMALLSLYAPSHKRWPPERGEHRMFFVCVCSCF
jgi:Wnt-binding factor required for Wnt secretion